MRTPRVAATLIAILCSAAPLAALDAPMLVVQNGHSDSITSCAVSSDGRFALSGSADATMILWDLGSGKQMRTFFSSSRTGIQAVALTHDGKTALSCSGLAGVVSSWDLASGKQNWSLALDVPASADAVAVTPDDLHALVVSGSSVILIRAESGAVEGRLNGGLNGARGLLTSVAVSPSGRSALLGARDGSVLVWDFASGGDPRILSGHSDTVTSVAFAKDGRRGVSGSSDGTVRVWDIADDGREMRRFTGGKGPITCVSFSDDDRQVLCGSEAGWIVALDADSGAELGSFQGDTWISAIVPAGDGNFLFSDTSSKLTLVDGVSWKSVRSFPDWNQSGAITYLEPVGRDFFTPDGDQILLAGGDRQMRSWKLSEARFVPEQRQWWELSGPHPSGIIDNLALSPDRTRLLTGTNPISSADGSRLQLWDLPQAKLVRELDAGTKSPIVMAGMTSTVAIAGFYDGTVKRWSARTGEEIPSFNAAPGEEVLVMAASPDGRVLLSISNAGSFHVWDIAARRSVLSFALPDYRVECAAVSPNGRVAATSSSDASIDLWDLRTGKKLKTLAGHAARVAALQFSPDARSLLSGSDDRTIILWDVATGRALRTLSGTVSRVLSVSFSPDGRRAASFSLDRVVRLWDLSTGRWVAFLTLPNGKDWLIFTDDGYWDSSPKAGEMVAMARGMEDWNIDQFAVRNNRPDIILQRLGCTAKPRIDYYRTLYQKRLDRLGLKESALTSDDGAPEARFLSSRQSDKHVALDLLFRSPRGEEIAWYNIYVNDVPLFSAPGKKTAGSEVRVTEDVELTGGMNKVEISCMDAGGAESYRPSRFIPWSGRSLPDLYFVGFGVSHYRYTYNGASIDLKYAAKDAQDLGAFFARIPQGSYGRVISSVFADDKATVDGIRAARDILGQARPDDTVIMFVSGHGLYDAHSTYYYLTNEARIDRLAETAAPFALFDELLQGTAARNKLFLMDTCASGERDPSRPVFTAGGKGIRVVAAVSDTGTASASSSGTGGYQPWRFERDRYVYNDLYRRSGAIVFSSCTGDQVSWESDDYRNGLFTRFILEALAGKADTNGDGIVDSQELRSYVSREVLSETRTGYLREQLPVVDRDNIYATLPLPVGRP
jgi:WD40 repeat protein